MTGMGRHGTQWPPWRAAAKPVITNSVNTLLYFPPSTEIGKFSIVYVFQFDYYNNNYYSYSEVSLILLLLLPEPLKPQDFWSSNYQDDI